MYRNRIVMLSALVVVAGVGAVTTITLRHGFSARDEPTRLEALAARTARTLAVPRSAKRLRDPLPPTAENLALGRQSWAISCATCHANDGSGHTEIGRNVYPKAPDLRLPATQNLSEGELYYTIRNGIRLTAMPAWGPPPRAGEPEAGRADLWRLVQFIRHLPQVTPAEVRDMRRMNPTIPAEVPPPPGGPGQVP